MPNIGEQEENPVHMSAPPGFGGQGVVEKLPMAKPVPSAPVPPAFDWGSAVGAQPLATSSMPLAPPGYTPGYTAPIRAAEKDSFIYRFGEVLSAFGTKPGDIPASISLRMAEQAAELEVSKNKLAWDNYYAHNQLAHETMKAHNRAAMQQGLGMLPDFKGMVHSIADPVERTQMATHLGKILDNFAPGLGKVMHLMDKDPTRILGYDLIMQHPVYGPQYQKLAATMSYEQQMNDPGIQQLVEMMGRDMLPAVVARFKKVKGEAASKLASGTMTENEFRAAYDEASTDESLGPPSQTKLAFTKSILNTKYGQEIMAGMHVKMNSTELAIQKKEKPEGQQDLEKELKNERILAAKEVLADTTGKYSKEHIAKAKDQLDIYAALKAKETNVGINPNNRVEQRIRELTGKDITSADIYAMPVGPEKTEALQLLTQASKENDKASATAAAGAKMGMQHDFVTNPAFTMDSNGDITPFKGEMSQEAFNKSNLFSMTSDQQERYGKIQLVKHGGAQLNDLAEKAYKKNSSFWNVAEEIMMKTEVSAALVAKTNPDLYNYVKQRDTVLGNYAKALGGETGVLTDQDISRVKNMFASPSSSAKTRAATRKAFEDLIKINQKALGSVLVGNQGTGNEGTLTPDQLASVKNSKEVRAQIEKVFSTVAGTVGSEMQNNSSTRAERLVEKMRGKP